MSGEDFVHSLNQISRKSKLKEVMVLVEKLSKICFVFAGIVSGLNDKGVGSGMADADGGEMPVYFYRQGGYTSNIRGAFPQIESTPNRLT